MIYVGNYSSWIDPRHVDYMLQNDGTARPSGGGNPDSAEFRQAPSAGYDLSKTYWYIYEAHTFPFEVRIPFDDRKDFIWWAIKMKPGNFMPMHRDPHTTDVELKNCKRYWMALQDYEPGHIFMYDRQVLVDYQKGDVFQYPDAQEIHGACNIGYNTRLTFHFSTYDR